MNRIARNLSILFLAEALVIVLVATQCQGCTADELVDVEPDSELDCSAGGLLCPCTDNSDCAGHGLGGARGECNVGLCTVLCVDDSECAAVPAATCGPLTLLGARECSVACDELDAPCDELGLPHATCIGVTEHGPVELVCGGAR